MTTEATTVESLAATKRLSTVFDYILLLTAGMLMTGPLWGGDLFYSHENLLLPLRVSQVHRSVMEGIGFVRWFPDYALGFGVPQLVFFPPLTLYLTELFHLLGLSLYQAIKVVFGLGIITAALGMYLLVRSIYDRLSGILSAVVYIYAPYHILNLYVRGDLHEFLALSFMPFILFGVSRFQAVRWLRFWVLACVSYTGLILCHNLSAVLFTPALLLFCLLFAWFTETRSVIFMRCITFLAATYLITAFFWGPALVEQKYVKIEVLTKGFGNYKDHFIELPQFISREWGFGESVRGPNDTISFQIGNVALVLSVLSIFLVLPRFTLRSKRTACALWAFLIVPGSVFLMTQWSGVLWRTIPLLPYFQFPYRFLALATLGTAILSGSVVSLVHPRLILIKAGVAFILIAVIMLLHLPYCKVIDYVRVPAEKITPELVRSLRNTIATGEYIPKWVPEFPPPRPFQGQLKRIPKDGFTREEMNQRLQDRLLRDRELDLYLQPTIPLGGQPIKPQSVEILSGSCVVHDMKFGCESIAISGYSLKPSRLRIGTFFYPGWRCIVNGIDSAISPDDQTGLMTIAVGEGSQEIRLSFGSTLVRFICGLISLGTLVVVVAALLSRVRHS